MLYCKLKICIFKKCLQSFIVRNRNACPFLEYCQRKNFVNKDCTVPITALFLNCQRNSLKVVMKTDIFQFDKINTLLLVHGRKDQLTW